MARVGLMGAMSQEISLLAQKMVNPAMEERGGRTFMLGNLYGMEAVLAHSKWGKVAAADTAVTMIERFEIDYIIFVGVAGAVDPTLNIGDIVISTELYQHDMDARPFFKHNEIPLTDKIFFLASTKLIELAKLASHNFLNTKLDSILTEEQRRRFLLDNPKIHLGIIASGDRFISDHSEVVRHPDKPLAAIEMEGAAVAQVCADRDIPFVVIRTISDRANREAALHFETFVEEVVCHYSDGIVENMLQYLR